MSDKYLCNLRTVPPDLLETNTNIYTRTVHLSFIACGRFIAVVLTSRLTLLWLSAFTTALLHRTTQLTWVRSEPVFSQIMGHILLYRCRLNSDDANVLLQQEEWSENQ